MHDNKIRISRDVLDKAELIAAEWGLKNARAAVEAVFRCYSDDYLSRHRMGVAPSPNLYAAANAMIQPAPMKTVGQPQQCEALSALDDLLAM
ncbi:MAG: hypothetical protein QNJ46_32710 [Leptolyngbyaceae cyanobacterium MO_188.B28]|nr:hypothetical protein [Leptolyngbyaceae cyanobacterium MO_188.B28]